MLERIADDVWGHLGSVKIGVGRLPTRATVLRLADGALVLYSPLRIDDATAKEIDALGEVRWLVSPNCYHWLYLRAAKERYPHARVFGPSGLKKKIGDFAYEPLPDSGKIAGLDELDLQLVAGAPAMEEHVAYHARSGSLVCSDLLFNVEECESFAMRMVMRLTGTWRTTAMSRMWKLLVKDRAAAAASAQRILGWSFDRVVVGHGSVITPDAHARAERALEWMVAGAPRALAAARDTAPR